MYWPEALTVKVPFAYVALPAGPTGPISMSSQPEGRAADSTVKEREVLFVRVPDVPVMVTGKVPVAALMATVRVSTLELPALLGLNEAVTPLGKPEAERFTVPLKPPCGVTVTVAVPLDAWKILRLEGEAASEKFPSVFTARATLVELAKIPDVPVTVTLYTPTVAPLPAVKVSVLVPAVLVGLKEAVTPLGKPDKDKFTVLLKPFSAFTLITVLALLPCVIVTLAGDAVSEKPGTGPLVGQLATRLVAFRVPIPVAKSHPVEVP